MLLRTILFLLAGFLIVPRLLRLLTGGKSRQELRRHEKARSANPAGRLRDLTQQDISDAEFEEISPEE